jgi:anthranilate synthase component 1
MIYHQKFIIDQYTPITIYNKLRTFYKEETPTLLFESISTNQSGNYSFITIGAKESIISQDGESIYIDEDKNQKTVDSNPLIFLKEYYKSIDTDIHKSYCRDLDVGFVDGFIGYIGFDMAKEFEPTLKAHMEDLEDELGLPDFYMIRPKLTLVYSHKNCELTMITSTKSLQKEFSTIIDILKEDTSYVELQKSDIEKNQKFNITKDRFFKLVDICKEHIKRGDIFQILITNRLILKAKIDAFSLYRKIRAVNPSPYLFLLEFKDFALAGSSPEVMVKLQDGKITLKPIAGTRKRGKDKKRDKELEEELLADQKEISEHIMLIDLGRNDVGRVAKKGSVVMTEIMSVEKYSHVMHIVSSLDATLDDKYDMFDLIMATFTAGTMTGAPKIRAMELIAKLEQTKRGPYSGTIGYFGFDGNMDSTITIRTAIIKEDIVSLQAGAGIVLDSRPELEFLEIENKLNILTQSIDDLTNR